MAVTDQPDLTVVVPAYNEAGTIEAVIERLRVLPYSLQIIVVDDCSQDDTAAIAGRLEGVELLRRDIVYRGEAGGWR